jgi:hypothetical protein
MSVPKPKTQATFFDAAVLVDGLFGPTDRFRLFREKILPILWAKREALCELYCEENGRASIEPVVLFGATLLQFMEKVPDRQAAENVRVHVGWKFALDLEMSDTGFHPTSLVKFRNRLVAGGAERIGFDAILEGLGEEGLISKARKQRVDSTHVLGAVARMSRLENVRETIRLFLQVVQRLDLQEAIGNWSILEERYIESEIQWHRISAQTQKEKFAQAGRDALALIKWVRGQSGSVREEDKTLLLERMFLEQYALEPGGPQRHRCDPSGAMKNPHDPDMQWSSKGNKQWEGYKLQVSETVAADGQPKAKGEPTEEFITEVTTTKAIVGDIRGRRQLEQNQRDNGQPVADEAYVDAGYVSDDTLAEAEANGRELVGPARSSHNPSGKNLFAADAFDVDVAHRKAVCPAGHESCQCSSLTNQETGDVQYRFEWAGLCNTCHLQKQCTKSKSGRRMLVVGEHHDLLQQRRREMQTEAFKKRMHQRNGIEATISEYVRAGGRRTRYRGMGKVTLGNYLLGAAVNIKRWLRLLQWRLESAPMPA